MLVKSKKSAIIMACIFEAPVIVIALLVGQISYQLAAAEQYAKATATFAGIGPILIAATWLLGLGILFLLINQLDESHYGRQGAVRWAIAGVIYAILQQVTLTLNPPDIPLWSLPFLIMIITGDLVWKAATLVLSYLLVFPLISLLQNRLQRAQRKKSQVSRPETK